MPEPIFTFDPNLHRYYLDAKEIPGVSDILEEGGLKHSYGGFEDAQWRGLHVHNATELLDLGDLDWGSVYPQWVGYVKAWERFKQDEGFEPTLIEYQDWHRAYRYAGTLDRRGVLNGEYALLDLKTSVQEEPWWKWQLAGYQLLRGNEWLADRRIVVQLRENGTWHMIEYKDQTDWRVFLAAMTICHTKRSMK